MPGLRVSFLEIGSEWVSYATRFGDRRRRGGEKGGRKSPLRIISGMDRSMSVASPTRIFPTSFSALGQTD